MQSQRAQDAGAGRGGFSGADEGEAVYEDFRAGDHGEGRYQPVYVLSALSGYLPVSYTHLVI